MGPDFSDNQRRTICRVLFLLVCALPTLVTVYFATHQRSANDWAQLLKAELGVETSIGVVETPRPGEMVFHDVKLYDDSGKEIFHSVKAYATLGSVNQIEFRNQIHVSTGGVSHFLNESASRLVRPGSSLKPWRVVFNDIEVVDEKTSAYSSFQSSRVLVKLDYGVNGSELSLETNDWGKVTLARAPDSGEISIEVVTNNDGVVPCWLVRNWFPTLEEMVGTNAHFSGIARIESPGEHLSCVISGNFIAVDVPYAPLSITDDDNSVIQVEGFTLHGNQWTEGMAWVLSNDQRVELPKPNLRFEAPHPREIVSEVIRNAFHDGSTARRFR